MPDRVSRNVLVKKTIASCCAIFFALLVTDCQSPSQVALTPTRTAAVPYVDSTATLRADSDINSIEVLVYALDEKATVGKTITMKISFRPIILRVTRRSDGSISSTSRTLWNSPSVTEMRWCQSLDARCDPTDNWTPFKAEQETKIQVDWSGARTVWITAQFRDANGRIIPSIGSENPDSPSSLSRYSVQVVGIVDDKTPQGLLPAPVQTSTAATRTAYPVMGFVRIENGRCCAGGKAGTTISVQVEFGAMSPLGDVKEMRVKDFRSRKCADESEMNQTAWEPLVREKTYRIAVVINFTSFDISVQYRDTKGNLSPIYCGDLAVEGSP